MMPSKVNFRGLEQLLLRQIQLEQTSISEVHAVTCAHELNRDMVPNRRIWAKDHSRDHRAHLPGGHMFIMPTLRPSTR
jgi:hypothetical protein